MKTIELSQALQNIRGKAIKKVKSFLRKEKNVDMSDQDLTLFIGTRHCVVTQVTETKVCGECNETSVDFDANLDELMTDDLLCLLDELERMKKSKQL